MRYKVVDTSPILSSYYFQFGLNEESDMFVHSVVFWLKDGLSEDEVGYFEVEANKLLRIESVAHGWVGTPAETSRGGIDSSYDFLLTIINENYEDQMAYQVDPIHDVFKENCEKFFEKVVIYDAD
jgi:hypothetical protein